MSNDKKDICDLCGLTVEVRGFKLKTQVGNKQFCCEGCKGIFQMLHDDQILSDSDDSTDNPTP
ncbi:MAG: heavy metal translocating P-type ATPase metal-binding domain-containing protein [Methylococcales bacterium]|nr:heavy metal translocating P-type ATPase metal-binding domain-containing protein [Methylococcales bacterium]